MSNVDQKKLLTSSKILPFYAERFAKEPDQFPPIAVELHWTSDCNYDCIHCSYGSRRQTRGRLTADQIQAVVDDLISMGVQAVYLSGGGEPTVVKGWGDYSRQLVDAGVEVSLITNGAALHKADKDLLARFNYIAVSVYSTDEAQYQQITESRDFERQWQIPRLFDSKSDKKVVVGARCVLNNINYRNIIPIYHRTREAGYDYIIFIPAVDYEGRGIGLNRDEQRWIADEIRAHEGEIDSSFTNSLAVASRDINHYDTGRYLEQFNSAPSSCSAVHIRANAFVNYCGGIWLCQPHIGNLDYCIGNLNQAPFSTIWNSAGHLRVARALHAEFAGGRCKNCRSIQFNRAIDAYVKDPIPLDDLEKDPFV